MAADENMQKTRSKKKGTSFWHFLCKTNAVDVIFGNTVNVHAFCWKGMRKNAVVGFQPLDHNKHKTNVNKTFGSSVVGFFPSTNLPQRVNSTNEQMELSRCGVGIPTTKPQ